jgi:hypothetical protein
LVGVPGSLIWYVGVSENCEIGDPQQRITGLDQQANLSDHRKRGPLRLPSAGRRVNRTGASNDFEPGPGPEHVVVIITLRSAARTE